MISKSYKSRVKKIIQNALKKNLIKSYSQFCETDNSDNLSLKEDEVNYYKSQNKGETDKDWNFFNVGDIVFVLNYRYKKGLTFK